MGMDLSADNRIVIDPAICHGKPVMAVAMGWYGARRWR
jgi:hypothetical protein